MKSFIKRFVPCVLVLLSVCVFSACDIGNQHQHVYSWYLAKEPSCTKNGILEGVCECGEKSFEEVKSTGHNFVNGVCSKCGEDKEQDNNQNNDQKVEQGQSLGLNINKVYEIFRTYGRSVSFSEFINGLNGAMLQNIQIDGLGVLHCVLSYNGSSADVILPSLKIDFKLNNINGLKNLLQLKVGYDRFDGEKLLEVVLVDGTKVTLGKISGINKNNQNLAEKSVRSIFINQDNVFGVVYSDDTVVAVSKIANINTPINGAQLCYDKIDGKQEYEVVCALNLNDTKIEIPATHLGLPITRVAGYAFYNNKAITEVILGENIVSLGSLAFGECKELTTIKFNQGIKEIGTFCFTNCAKLQNPVIPASVIRFGNNAFSKTNCSIYVDLTQKPSAWSNSWCSSNNKVYWKGEWNYVNDIPVPLQ